MTRLIMWVLTIVVLSTILSIALARLLWALPLDPLAAAEFTLTRDEQREMFRRYAPELVVAEGASRGGSGYTHLPATQRMAHVTYERSHVAIVEYSAGWPFRCLVGAVVETREFDGKALHGADVRVWITAAGFPYQPLWLGLTANALLVSTPIVAILLVLRHARRRWRASRNRCPRCAYQMSGLTRCPECGHTQ